MTRAVTPSAIRGDAVQACGRLAREVAPRSPAVDRMLHAALQSEDPEIVRMGLRELAGLLALGRDIDPADWQQHASPVVRAAADQLARARRGEPTTD
jgi:alpha-D-ribose 1-methylphosphonate 5-triphosphate diphosphatase PhnM